MTDDQEYWAAEYRAAINRRNLTLNVWATPELIKAELIGTTGIHCPAGAFHPDEPVEIVLVSHPSNPPSAARDLIVAACGGDEDAKNALVDMLWQAWREEWIDPCDQETDWQPDWEEEGTA
jgi:hypothetical protein